MSDNQRRYREVRKQRNQLYPTEPQGNLARHLNTLAGIIRGIVGSRRTNFPDVANRVPDGTKRDSRVKRFTRWVKNDDITFETYFMPFAQAVLMSLAQQPLVLVMDGSTVGRGCVTLMLSVVYQKSAVPIAWVVIKGSKGHFPEDPHIALLEQVHGLLPAGVQVVFLGDGEVDGTKLQATVKGWGWQYVCRTAKNITLAKDNRVFSSAEREVKRGECLSVPEVTFTGEAYGPVLAIAWWGKNHKEPLYLVSNMASAEEACQWYAKRFRIETFFSDQKSRGFHLHKSHLSDPARLSRLMIAACLAYIWIIFIFLGVLAVRDGWIKVIHRTKRCDVSLFHLGLDLLEHFLNEGLSIPVAFQFSQVWSWEAL